MEHPVGWSGWGLQVRIYSVPGKAGTTPSPDLNLLIVNGFGWYGRVTGRREYLDHGDIIFQSGVRQAYLKGRKQFNENYAHSFRYLSYRRPSTR